MELFNTREIEGATLAVDPRMLQGAALFASSETAARPILASVAVCFNKADVASGTIVPFAYVATDSYRLAVVGGVAKHSPMELRNAVCIDADVQYVLLSVADIAKLKVTRTTQFATVAIQGGATYSNVTTTTFKGWTGGASGLAEMTPASRRSYTDQTSIGTLVDGEYPQLRSILPEQEPNLYGVPHLCFNPKYMATYHAFSKLFNKDGDTPLVLRGAGSELKPAIWTIREGDDAQLLSLLMPVRKTEIGEW